MKTITLIAISTVAVTISFSTMAETYVKDTIVVNTSYNKDNATIADGKYNLASTGSINIRNSRLEKSEVYNESRNKGNVTIATGEGNTATTGSITFE